MESHASAARGGLIGTARERVAASARRFHAELDAVVTAGVAAVLAAIAFVGNGGLQLGSTTLVEIGVIGISSVLVAAALVLVGLRAAVHGGATLAALAALAGLTALSILWSLYPNDSWVETNRTLAYLAAFTAGIAAVRIARERWAAVGWGVLLALAAVSSYGLATKVAPGWLAPDEVYARLREPYGYWNAVGLTAAMAIPLCLWLGTREGGRRRSSIVAYPLLAVFIVTMLLSFSRGSIIAAAVGVALWLAIVPMRLRSLALLLTSSLAATAVTAWAFSQSALTDDRIALADRKDAGLELGFILLVTIVLCAVAGYAIQRRAEHHPLAEPVRRKLGIGALGALAAVPLVMLAALAFSDRGVGGTISDRWHDLTSEQGTPQNDPGRLIQTGSVRTIYWGRAIDVWQAHKLAGAGAGSFAEAQLKYREQPAQGRHAHGYIHQTLADLGLLGLGSSLVALAAWFLTAGRTLALWPRVRGAAWTPERQGLVALALVAVVFGAHSALDWTWFVPAVAVTGLFCAGWVAGRGSVLAAAPGASASGQPEAQPDSQPNPQRKAQPKEQPKAAHAPPLAQVKPALPRARARRRVLAIGVPVLAFAVLTSVAVSQPWRSERKGNDALNLAGKGNFRAALAATASAHDLDPLSVDPYFDRAAVEDAAGHKAAARTALEQAVRVQPASPEAWQRLGEYYLNDLSLPAKAVPVLRAAIYLDPFSQQSRTEYVVALRAQQVQALQAAEAQRLRARAKSVRRRSGTPPAAPSSTSP
jgi:tetratricopeptide (TPR) repeat protein